MTALYDRHEDFGSAFTFGKASIEPANTLEPSDFTASFRSDSEDDVQFQGQSIGKYDNSLCNRNKLWTRFNIRMPMSILLVVGILSLVYYAL